MTKRIKKTVALSILSILICTNLFASVSISGKVLSEDTNSPIVGANVYSTENNTQGVLTDYNGNFDFQIEETTNSITIYIMGYEKKLIQINKSASSIDLGEIILNPQSIDLEEVKIIASIAQDRKTPVSVSTVKAEMIEQKMGDQTYPEILKQTPGFYATRSGGGSGDARVSLRGFQQENIALLLNGIPISSVENGLIYWNNWIGLAEATQMIQVQKGLGASKIALNSLGGTINIITKSTEASEGGSIQHSLTSYGNQKTTFSYSTGLMDNGWAITFLGSRTSGDGYVDATYVDGWSYFLSAGKQFGKDHKIVMTLLGAPEKHGQNNFMLSQNEIDQYGIKFNKGWGSYNSKMNNATENFYHKPQLSINHYWNINKKSFLATSAYISLGNGGGKWTESAIWGTTLFNSFRNPSQQIDWDAVYELNASSPDGESQIIQTDYLASHIWTGVLTNLEHQINDNWKLISGFHYRYFKSKLQEKVRDLLGGSFWIDSYGWALEGAGGRNTIKGVGDVINVDNGALIHFGHFFNQIEYNTNKINTFVAASFSNTWYQREDRYNYLTDTKSETISKSSFDVKTGVNYNISNENNIYFNTGFYSKAPLFKFVFPNYNNNAALDIKNENVIAMELGFSHKTNNFTFNINAYYTYWKDISFLSKEYIPLENNSDTRALVKGLDALHKGIEAVAKAKVAINTEIGAFLSIGEWKWKNDVSAGIFDINNIYLGTTEVYVDGLKVGDAPQTQLGAYFKTKVLNRFNFEIDWAYNDHLYANFDPTSRNNPNDRDQSFKLPSYHIFDAHINIPVQIWNKQTNLGLSCYNIFNTSHILRGEDGESHDLDTFVGYWGFERTFNIYFKMNF